MICGVEASDHGKQHLRSADVAGGLLAPDVLLARLQREAICGAALRVDRHTDQTTGQGSFVRILRCDERGVRAAEHQWHAESLRRPHHDVGAHLARRSQHHQRQQVGRHGHHRAGVVSGCDQWLDVGDPPARARVLQQHTEHTARGQRIVDRSYQYLDAQRLGTGLDHCDGLRVTVGVDDEDIAGFVVQAMTHRHRLSRRCASSSNEAFASSIPVRSVTIVWKLTSASSRPCEISGWYGV